MTLIKKELTGMDLLQEELENIDFIVDNQGGVVFNPMMVDGETLNYATFTNTLHPGESENVGWVGSRLNWKRVASAEVTDFLAIISLYGLQLNGQEELIGEKIINTCPTTETVEDIIFNLKGSNGEPPVRNLTGLAAADKIQINLPFRYQNLESIYLYRNWLNGWSKRKRVPLTGSTPGVLNAIVNVTVPYDSDMKSDFSDIRFLDSDGATQLCQYRNSYTASTTALFMVLVPVAPGVGVTKNIYVVYGNSSASLLSNVFSVFQLYENWEDGKYTGRSSPYTNWILEGGTVTFDTTTPLNGSITLKHTGNGSNSIGNKLAHSIPSSLNNNYVIAFLFKQTYNGVGSLTPYHHLCFIKYKNGGNLLRLITFYSGGNQILRLNSIVNGVSTTLADWTWVTGGKLPSNTNYNINIRVTPSLVAVYVDGTLRLITPYSHSFTGNMIGFGSNVDSAGEWDIIQVYPYYSYSVGALGGEETTTLINPDSGLDDDTQVLFSVPGDWSQDSSCYLRVKEYFSTAYDTDDVKLSNRSIAELGYDNVDRYIALRQRVELWSNSLCSVSFNKAEYTYEV